MYTHCPNCNTHFSITQEYLDIANGKVRCGKCDYVFNALENLYNNDNQARSPQLETAASTSEQEQAAAEPAENTDIKDTDQDNSLPETPARAEAQQTQNPEPEAEPEQPETPRENNPAVDVQAPFSPPLASIDIKEKMERIAASLSAATQELKNARQSVGFERSATHSSSKFSAPPSEQDSLKEPDKITAAEAAPEATTLDTSAETPTDSDKETLNVAEDTAEINTLEIINTADDALSAAPETAPEIEHEALSEELSEALSEQTSSAPPALEDELELVDFSDREDTEPFEQAPATDFNLPPVDESDIDILNSLIETQEHDDAASDSLIEELNDINKSLASDDISLDDELSQIENELDQELDSGADILNELEQLESEFHTSDNDSDTESSTDLDPLDNNLDGSPEQDLNATEQQAVPVVEEEVVPSFLTQGKAKTSSPATMFGWLFATLLMLSLLAAQYLHFNSLKLADNPDFRPFLETLCPLTGCILPLRKAPEKIITINHDVHTHPSVKDALEIQLSFRNKAGFTQQYPVLEVIFSNPRGEVIARRKFSPDEYLDNNTPYIAGIKPNQTEKIDLQIVDPDPGALLSFQFNYL